MSARHVLEADKDVVIIGIWDPGRRLDADKVFPAENLIAPVIEGQNVTLFGPTKMLPFVVVALNEAG